jgi:hypothetical protein
LISEPPTFLTRGGGGYQGLPRGVPAFYDENDDDDGVIAALLNEDVVIVALLQVALRAAVLQPGGLWSGPRDWLVASTILPQAPVQSGAGVESYSDASFGMATIMPISCEWQ